MNFASDNSLGAHPAILSALTAADDGRPAMAYGNDEQTARLHALFNDVFETDLQVFPVISGTAANALALSCCCPPWGVIFCQPNAHIHIDECGAPELFSGGARLQPVGGENGKIDPAALARALAMPLRPPHSMQPAVLSLTQACELGTIYSLDELTKLAAIAHDAGLMVHMDGARFANALVALDCSPAEMTWKAGIDVLSFGATKNGAVAAEAVVFFNPGQEGDFERRRKRAGHLISKMRFFSAQFLAYFDHDLWLDNARHANAMASRLADGLTAAGARLVYPVEANEIFIQLPAGAIAAARKAGAVFHDWPAAEPNIIRLVTGFSTPPADVDAFIACITQSLTQNP